MIGVERCVLGTAYTMRLASTSLLTFHRNESTAHPSGSSTLPAA